MATTKPVIKKHEAVNLWDQNVDSVDMKKFKKTAQSEKLLIAGETGSGKTKFYIDMFRYVHDVLNVKPDDFLATIVLPDRPTGITKLFGLFPKEYIEEDRIKIYPVEDYETTIKATASTHRLHIQHFNQTGKLGYSVFELMENYWSFSQNYFSRKAYGQSMGEYFAQMQSIMSDDKADKQSAYKAFAGPFGGPWPIIKFFHNFNWIDRIKRFPYHTIFTSELKEEDNKDSIFYEFGYRPAGEKHNQHKMDTVIITSHNNNKFFIKPYKLTGYTALYNKIDVSNKNDYEEHIKAKKILEKRGFRVSPLEELEQEAGITPPKKKEQPKKQEEQKKDTNTDSDWDL